MVLVVVMLLMTGALRPEVRGLVCSDRVLFLIGEAFGASQEPGGLAVLWLPTGRELLLGRSSASVTAGAGGALLVAPLFSLVLLPSDDELRLVGNPFTGSFDAVIATGRAVGAGC